MTPEERARHLLKYCQEVGKIRQDAGGLLIIYATSLIREAEKAATERAAGIVMKEGMFLTKLEYCEYLAHKIRAKV